MGITTTYSLWFIPLCLATAALYTVVLYLKNNREEFSKPLKLSLSVIRFLIVSLLCFFLLSPIVNIKTKNTEKPVIILAQDNSESILINKDSVFYKEKYPQLINDLTIKMKDKFEIKTFAFGNYIEDSLKFDFKQTSTDISGFFQYMSSVNYNTPVAAMILATDGIYNTGINPLYENHGINYPIYTIALGDTNIPKDISVQKINYNKMVFLNNKFSVEIVVNATLCENEKTELELIYDGKKIGTQTIDINNENFINTFSFNVFADKPGKKKLTANLKSIHKELTLINNTSSVFIDVIDSRQKILLLSDAPHPDIGAINSAIESNINYEVSQFSAKDFKENINAYSLIILHNLPSNSNSSSILLKHIENSSIPVLYIVGLQTNIAGFNNLNTGLNIKNTKSNVFNETFGVLNPGFSLFVVSENTQKTLLRLPPLYSYYGNYVSTISSISFLQQKIGQISTKNPLFMFNEVAGRKIGIITGEGIWRWRLMDFMENESHLATNEIINKTIQYLALKVEKSNFRLTHKDIFNENEAVVIDAEVYNESYELINTPDVNILIKGKEKEYAFTFSKTAKSYVLNAGLLPVDDYEYHAQVKIASSVLSKTGNFSVTDINKESLESTADHKLLYQISAKHKAKLYYPSEIEKLFDDIVKNNDIKPLIYIKKKTTDLISLSSLMFLLIFLLTIEWFVRKRMGSY